MIVFLFAIVGLLNVDSPSFNILDMIEEGINKSFERHFKDFKDNLGRLLDPKLNKDEFESFKKKTEKSLSDTKSDIDKLTSQFKDIHDLPDKLKKTESLTQKNKQNIQMLSDLFINLEKRLDSLVKSILEIEKVLREQDNAQDLKLKKWLDDFNQKDDLNNIVKGAKAANQILMQIQAFTQIKRIADTRNGQSLIYNFQLSESRNGKQIPLAGRQLVVGEQVLDGEVEESFTIDTDKDGIASFEASVEKRRQMNKRQAYFVVKFKGDALRKDATSSKFR